MKRTLKSVVAATIVLGTVVPSVFAANSQTDGAPSDISGNQYANAIGLMLNEGVMINYTGNAFQPSSHASRGQFIAYIYNILKNQGVITQDYTGANPYADEDTNFQKQINDMYLFGYLDGLDFSDKSGKDVIGEYWTAPAPWVAELLCNVAGVAYDNTKAWDAYKVACAQGWFKGTGYADGTTPSYYLNRDVMAQLLENFYASQYPSALQGVPASISVAPATAAVAQGASDALTVSGKDYAGNAATIDPSQVTYSVYGNTSTNQNDGFVNSAGQFTATAPGTYTVSATYGTALVASTTINVYGTPSAITVKSGNLVADAEGAAKTTVTATVVDQNGNTATNYNGPVTLTLSNGADASFASSGAAETTFTANAVNGVATFTVYSGTGATAGDTVTATASEYNNATVTGTGSISVVAATATSLGVNYATYAPNGLAVNSGGSTSIVVQALDQAGNLINTYNNWATLTISGPATFASTGTTTQTVWLGAGTTPNIVINGKTGVSGNVVVTVSAPGLTTQTMTIPAYIQTGVSTLVATASKTTVGANNTDYTTITVKALDSNGDLDLSDNSPLTITDNNTSSGDVHYTPVSGYTANQLNDGEYQFEVLDSGYQGADTISIVDSTDNLSTSAGLSFTAGTASQIAALQTSVKAASGATVPVTFQVEDAGGNAIAQSGDTFTLTTTGGTLSATTATTNASGQFTVNVTLPSSGSVTVTATPSATESSNGLSGTGSETIVGVSGSSLANLATSVSSDVYGNGSTINATAGVPVYLDVYGLNGIGGNVNNDSFSVSSSNSAIAEVLGRTTTGASFSSSVTSSIPGVQGTANSSTGYIEILPQLGGTATVTFKDTSVVGAPTETVTVNVAPTNSLGSVKLNGLSASEYVTPGTVYPVSVSLADAGGNPIYATTSTPGYSSTLGGVVVSLTDTINGSNGVGDFRNTSGSAITQVVIPVGSNSATVDWVAPTLPTGTTSVPVVVTANAGGVSTSVSSITLQ